MKRRLSVVALLIGSAGALLPAAALAQEGPRERFYEGRDGYRDHEYREHERREHERRERLERERREHEFRERERRERYYRNEYRRGGYYNAYGVWCPY
jgi:hypothetical protein